MELNCALAVRQLVRASLEPDVGAHQPGVRMAVGAQASAHSALCALLSLATIASLLFKSFKKKGNTEIFLIFGDFD